VTTIEELFRQCDNNGDNERNKTVKIVLMAQYQLYLWLKKRKLLTEDNIDISDENKKQFLKWINMQ